MSWFNFTTINTNTLQLTPYITLLSEIRPRSCASLCRRQFFCWGNGKIREMLPRQSRNYPFFIIWLPACLWSKYNILLNS